MGWWKNLDPVERWMMLGLGGVAALVALFLRIASEVGEGETSTFDNSVLMAFRVPEHPSEPIGPAWVQEMARDLTALGSFAVLGLLVAGVVLFLLLSNKRGRALFVLVSVLGGTAISTVLKMSYDRPRPELTEVARVFTASFPSGHSMLSAVTFLTLGALLSELQPQRRLKVYFISVAVLLTLIVGISRLYLGVHYPTDVLAGWAAGAAWAALCLVVATWLRRRGKLHETA
ncbi:hypothetical protein JP74_01065 [Devosia sp. 17-2-E-8]|nr:hypothetical protein JP74_01065 [Devosia sp. 17-2-E-8]